MNKPLVITLGAVVFIAVVALAAWFTFFSRQGVLVDESTSLSEPDITVRDSNDFVAKLDSGDYEEALATFEYLYGDSYTEEPNELARSKTTKDVLDYKVNYSLKNIVDYIDNQKSIADNGLVEPRLRARALNQVALAFCIFGRNPDLLPHIYSGPYQKYMDDLDPGYAAFLVLKDSFELYETPRAAIGMSHWYIKKLLGEELTDTEKTEYTAEAEALLMLADSLAETEMVRTANFATSDQYVNSRRYSSYLFWRAFVVGGLASIVGGEYKDEWKQEYQDFFTLVENMDDHNIYQYLPPAYEVYAYFLLTIDNDTEGADIAINQAVDYVEADPRPEINEFTIFMSHERKKKRTDIFWDIMTDMAEFSPRFKEFIDNAAATVVVK